MRRLVHSARTACLRGNHSCTLIQVASLRRYSTQGALAQDENTSDDYDNAVSSSAFPSTFATKQPSKKPDHGPIRLPSLTDRGMIALDTPRMPSVKKGRAAKWSVPDHDSMALLDACLATGNSKRALTILEQAHKLGNKEKLLFAVNRFLVFLMEQVRDATTYHNLESEFLRFKSSWQVQADAISYAIMCKGALLTRDQSLTETKVEELVKSWLNLNRNFGELLSVSNILSQEEAQQIFELSKVDYRFIGLEYRTLLVIKKPGLHEVPELKPTIQSGNGLKFVKQSLNALTNEDVELKFDTSAYNDEKQFKLNLARQRQLEEDSLEAAVLRWREEHDDLKKRGGVSHQKSLNAMLWEWHEIMVPLIEQEIVRIQEDSQRKSSRKSRTSRTQVEKSSEAQQADAPIPVNGRQADYETLMQSLLKPGVPQPRIEYGPFLKLLKSKTIAAVVIMEVLRSFSTSSTDGVKTVALAVKIGRALENEYHSEILKKKSMQDLYQSTYKEALQNQRLFSRSVRQARENAAKHSADASVFELQWTQNIRGRLGALLLSFLLYAARMNISATIPDGSVVTQEIPVFHHAYAYVRGQKMGMIKACDQFSKKLSSEPLKGSIAPRLLPMLVMPRPWFSWNSGGYLLTRTLALRAKDCPEQIEYLKAASQRGMLTDVLTALDVLGRTAWSVNERVFQCAAAAWNSGKAIAGIPPAASMPDLPPAPPVDADPLIKYTYIEKVREASSMVKNFASMRSDINYKLEIARAFLGETMYFPHSLDFRGRAYPVPPHFNHLGNDLCRGLLMFKTAKELGANGLRWLKIHLANQCGMDKASFEERVAYADANVERVFEANDHPMDGTRWWTQVENPWQCLATCFELTAALRSPNPEKFRSSMPVHQDGTCNGLQHYAALGGDLVGAKQVNLEPSDRPQDVYQAVADIVSEATAKDADAGDKTAIMLRGRITRKLVKQTVMTNVYGVTWIGARLQVESQLSDMPAFSSWTKEDLFPLCTFLVQKIFMAIGHLFTGAQAIQDWLRRSASIISRSIHIDALLGEIDDPMTSVIWTSPLELPIVQPYRDVKKHQITTNLQTLFISDPMVAARVNSRKQASAFPPNFIHSLDASHMLMSALACHQTGIDFAAVHDSYWTHAADTDTMNVILREAFIKLHSENIMQDLVAEFYKRYAKNYTPHFTPRGSAAASAATSLEHIASGKIRVLPNARDVVVLDPELVKELAELNNEELVPMKRTARDLQATGISRIRLEAAKGKAKRKSAVAATKSDAVTDLHDGVMDHENMDAAEEENEENDEKQGYMPYQRAKGIIYWTPIAFPELPQRGEFDVKSLKNSKYFFS